MGLEDSSGVAFSKGRGNSVSVLRFRDWEGRMQEGVRTGIRRQVVVSSQLSLFLCAHLSLESLDGVNVAAGVWGGDAQVL